jgi:peptidoglycan/LPS O-acetylase OafA/YrhL
MIHYLLLGIVLIKSYYILFIAGMLLCDLQVHGKLPVPRAGVRSLMLLIACWLGSYRLLAEHSFWHLLDPLCHVIKPSAIGAILLFYAVITSERIQHVLDKPLFRFLGNISYSLYLVHLLVICSFSCILFTWLHHSCSYHLSFIVTFIVSVPLVLLIAQWLTATVDLQGIRFSKWFYRRLFR